MPQNTQESQRSRGPKTTRANGTRLAWRHHPAPFVDHVVCGSGFEGKGWRSAWGYDRNIDRQIRICTLPWARLHCRKRVSSAISVSLPENEQRGWRLHWAEARIWPVFQPLVRREVPERRAGWRPVYRAVQEISVLCSGKHDSLVVSPLDDHPLYLKHRCSSFQLWDPWDPLFCTGSGSPHTPG